MPRKKTQAKRVSSAAKVRVVNSLSPFVTREGVKAGTDGKQVLVDLGPAIGTKLFDPSELERI